MTGAAATLTLPLALRAAPPFWNRKPSSDWTGEEILQLLTKSPWAHETNIDFEATEGGHLETPVGGGAAGQDQQMGSGRGQASDPTAGSMRRAPVLVRWDSAQPLRDTLQLPAIGDFDGRYVIGVSNIPPAVMNRRRRGESETTIPMDDFLAELQGAATLQAPGREPAGAGHVRHVPGSENNYLFGFSRDLFPISANDKEVQFVLRTARVSVKAKFEPKNMTYRGKLAV